MNSARQESYQNGIIYEHEFEQKILSSLGGNWKRTGAVKDDVVLVAHFHPVYNNKYNVPDYYLVGTNKWLEIKTVVPAHANRGTVSMSLRELEHFKLMEDQDQSIYILRHVQNAPIEEYEIYEFDSGLVERHIEFVVMHCRNLTEI